LKLNETGGGELLTDAGLIYIVDTLPKSIMSLSIEVHGGNGLTDKFLAILGDLQKFDSLEDLRINAGECQGTCRQIYIYIYITTIMN